MSGEAEGRRGSGCCAEEELLVNFRSEEETNKEPKKVRDFKLEPFRVSEHPPPSKGLFLLITHWLNHHCNVDFIVLVSQHCAYNCMLFLNSCAISKFTLF